MSSNIPKILAVTGIDGSGKTTIANWMQEELLHRGHQPAIVWSRFNNFLSRPYLLVTRLTGHNYYEVNEGVRMGYHHFQDFPRVLRWLFVWLQIIDVRAANQRRIIRPARRMPLTICERGPWDTLVDVASDTGFEELAKPPYPRRFMGELADCTEILLIDRNLELIRSARPELAHDTRIEYRQHYYRALANNCDWQVLDNNDTLESACRRTGEWLDAVGY